MLFGKLLPREGNFFELFDQHGAFIVEGARAFILLIQNYADPSLREKYANEVGTIELHWNRSRWLGWGRDLLPPTQHQSQADRANHQHYGDYCLRHD